MNKTHHMHLYTHGRQNLYYPSQAKQSYYPYPNNNLLLKGRKHSMDYETQGPKSKTQLQMLHCKLKNKNLKHPGYKTRHPNDVFAQDIELVYESRNGKGSIYVGNLQAAQNLQTLKKLRIGSLLTACKGIHIGHPSSQVPHYLYIPGQDHEFYDISAYFHEAVSFIKRAVQDTNVLVHCMAGISRSVSLVLAYLMKEQGMSFKKAYEQVKRRRRIIDPNKGFLKQLQYFQMSLTQKVQKKTQINLNRSQTNFKNPQQYGKTMGMDIQRSKSPDPYLEKRFSIQNQLFKNKYLTQKETKDLHSKSVYLDFKNQAYDRKQHNQNISEQKLFSSPVDQRQYNQVHLSRPKNFDVINQNRLRSALQTQKVNVYTNSKPNALSNYKQYNDLNKQLQQKIQAIKTKYQQYTKELSQNRAKRTKQKTLQKYSSNYQENKVLQSHNENFDQILRNSKTNYYTMKDYSVQNNKKVIDFYTSSKRPSQQNYCIGNKTFQGYSDIKRKMMIQMQILNQSRQSTRYQRDYTPMKSQKFTSQKQMQSSSKNYY